MSVVQIADMLEHLNLPADLDVALVQAKINAAEAWIEQFTGRALQTQTRTIYFDRFCRNLKLPVTPVQSITSVTYLDSTQTQQTLASNSYIATPLGSDDDPTYLYPASGTTWPVTARVKSAVTVTLQAGYYTPNPNNPYADTNVPLPLYEAIKLLVAYWYENREASLVGITSSELPFGLTDLLNRYRNWVF